MPPRKKGNDTQFTLRLPSELKAKCEQTARDNGVSLNDWFNSVLSEHIEGNKIPVNPETYKKIVSESQKLGMTIGYFSKLVFDTFFDESRPASTLNEDELYLRMLGKIEEYLDQRYEKMNVTFIPKEFVETDFDKRCRRCGELSPFNSTVCVYCGADLSDITSYTLQINESYVQHANEEEDINPE